MDMWTETANKLWQAILARAQELKDEGETLQSIANKVGVKNRVLIHYWLSGSRKAVDAPFANLMTYAERLGIDYRAYFPGGEPPVQEAPDCATCKKLLAKDREIQKLKRDYDRMRDALLGAQGEIRALERRLDKNEQASQPASQETAPKKMAG